MFASRRDRRPGIARGRVDPLHHGAGFDVASAANATSDPAASTAVALNYAKPRGIHSAQGVARPTSSEVTLRSNRPT